VSDIIGEISAAASEQSTGIGQVNGAVVQLDQMTQQNAALVEQSAAAAESLKDQANRLASVVAGFRLGGQADVRHAAPRASTPAATARPAPAAHAKVPAKAPVAARPKAAAPVAAPRPVATAPAPATVESGDWETF
jgi:methyl-accepting chemotaxis protein